VFDSVFNESRWFAEYLQPHESMLRAWLHGRVQSRHEIDDIVQEAYIRRLSFSRPPAIWRSIWPDTAKSPVRNL